jgi:hypothetical protein
MGRADQPCPPPSAALGPAQDAVARALGPLDGAVVPGGCDHCDAEQSTRPVAPGAWVLTIAHDPWCPTLATIEGRTRAVDP